VWRGGFVRAVVVPLPNSLYGDRHSEEVLRCCWMGCLLGTPSGEGDSRRRQRNKEGNGIPSLTVTCSLHVVVHFFFPTHATCTRQLLTHRRALTHTRGKGDGDMGARGKPGTGSSTRQAA
jgi:hypothetical protein